MGNPDNEHGGPPPKASPFEGLTSYDSFLSEQGAGGEGGQRYECGDCNVPSRHVRIYSLLTIIFVVFFLVWRVDDVMKCPKCMRRHILFRLPLAVLLSNLLSPVVVIWWLVAFVKTFVRPF